MRIFFDVFRFQIITYGIGMSLHYGHTSLANILRISTIVSTWIFTPSDNFSINKLPSIMS